MITFIVIVGLLIKSTYSLSNYPLYIRRFGECIRCLILRYMVRILDLLVISTKLILIVTFVLRLMTIKESNPKFEKIC